MLIRGNGRNNERLLPLHVHQLLLLQKYLDKNKFAQQLFSGDINQQVKYMFSQLQQLNKKIMHTYQIRASIIMQWLKQYNLRQVQYMAAVINM